MTCPAKRLKILAVVRAARLERYDVVNVCRRGDAPIALALNAKRGLG